MARYIRVEDIELNKRVAERAKLTEATRTPPVNSPLTGVDLKPFTPPPPGPHISLYQKPDGIFTWYWEVHSGGENSQLIARGAADTRWGAKWAARKAWRIHQKRGQDGPEIIPL